MNKKYLPYAGFALFVVLALFIMLAKPFSPGLNDIGQLTLGGLLITIGIWVFKPFKLSFAIGGLFFAFSMLVLKVKPAVVFSGFTSSALWTLIPALFFGYVLMKTGLGKRIALAIIKLFKPSYPSMMLAWVCIGVVLSILTPSITVRVAIVVPIAIQCCELFKLEKGSRGNSLLLLTAFAMAILPGAGWFTGSLWGPIIQGLFEAVPELSGIITFDSWWRAALVPMELTTLILVIGGYFTLKPKEKLSVEAIETSLAEERDPLTFAEKATAVILVIVFLLFVTNRIHGIPDAAVCLIALIAFFASGVMETKEFGTGVSWDLVVFFGIAFGMGQVFAATGISEWISGIIVPVLAPFAANPWLFVFMMVILLFLVRFVDVALLIPTIAILTPVLPVIASTFGISPLVWAILFVMAGNSFFVAYQNLWALMSQNMCGERAWSGAHLARYGTVYFIACLTSLCVAIPLWISSGLL